MIVSVDQLQAFVASAEHGSFSAAARALRKAQSAISTHIANLEADLGLALFSRAGRNPVLTAAGARLLMEAKVVLERREHLIGVASSFQAGVERRLVVAADPLYPEQELGAVLARFAQQFPHVELELSFPPKQDITALVLEGKADLGIRWRQELVPAELGFQAVGWVPIRLACNRRHPFAGMRVEWEDLKRHRQVLVSASDHESDPQRAMRVASEVWRVESHWAALEMVRQGVGWAFLPAHLIAGSPQAAELVMPELQFDDFDLPIALEMIWHKQRTRGPGSYWLRERLAGMRVGAAAAGPVLAEAGGNDEGAVRGLLEGRGACQASD